jgi:hypothetical protein
MITDGMFFAFLFLNVKRSSADNSKGYVIIELVKKDCVVHHQPD